MVLVASLNFRYQFPLANGKANSGIGTAWNTMRQCA
jgi:hypothetical protein